jgi:hypothetical protein
MFTLTSGSTLQTSDLHVGPHPRVNVKQNINPEDSDCTVHQNGTLLGNTLKPVTIHLHIQIMPALDPPTLLDTLSSTVKGQKRGDDLSPSSANAV